MKRGLTGHYVPIVTAAWVAKAIGVSIPTANKALQHLQNLGILSELTGAKYGRHYAYNAYLDILNEDADDSLPIT